LPSDEKKQEIEKVIQWKEELQKSAPPHLLKSDYYHIENDITPIMLLQNTTYEERSLNTLRSNLLKVGETYSEEDFYYIYEERSEKVNFYITNNGKEYLEDASIVLKIKKKEGLLVAKELYRKPNKPS